MLILRFKELAPKDTEITLSWDEAIMYCFSLGNGYRLPTKEEIYEYHKIGKSNLRGYYWTADESFSDSALMIALENWWDLDEYPDVYTYKKHTEFIVRAIRDTKPR